MKRVPQKTQISQQMEIVQCKTMGIKEMLEACSMREDNLSTNVNFGILGSVADLHAVDAQYHHDCITSLVN